MKKISSKELYTQVSRCLAASIESPVSELMYKNTFELLVAVILSAQCTDKRVNIVSRALFAAYPDARAMAGASVEDIFGYIKSVSYPNAKSTHLYKMAVALVEKFDGNVPSSRAQLESLAGVGRKTASVVLSVAFDKPEMAVDTHVFRVAARLGLTVGAKTPVAAEKQLVKGFSAVDAAEIGDKPISNIIGTAHHWLILHGRYLCTARKPACERCTLCEFCKYYSEK